MPLTSTPEIHINSATAGDQVKPRIARLTDGSFLVVWTEYSTAGTWTVMARRFDAQGVALTDAWTVTTTATGVQADPSVAALADGGYLISWDTHNAAGGANTDVVGQRYNSSNAAQGGEIVLNAAYMSDGQLAQSVAGLNNGSIVAVWASFFQDGNSYAIVGQRFDASGAAVGAQIIINDVTAGEQTHPRVTKLVDGGFVVSWQSADTSGQGWDIFVRRFDSSGVAQGVSQRINTHLGGNQQYGTVLALADGGFVVAWHSDDVSGGQSGVFAQRFAADGTMLGAELKLNASALTYQLSNGDGTFTTVSGQRHVELAQLNDGSLIAVWNGWNQDGSAWGAVGRRFTVTGQAIGSEFIVNTYSQNDQRYPQVTAMANGGFAVTWQSIGQEAANDWGLYAKVYDAPPAWATEGTGWTLDLDDVVDLTGADFIDIDWGDGTIDSVLVADLNADHTLTHTFADGGASRVVQVDAFDIAETLLDSGSYDIDVANVAPTLSLSGNASVLEGSSYTLTLGTVVDPGVETVTGYVVDWGDGSTQSVAVADLPANRQLTHTYADGTATRNIRVGVVDDDGTHHGAGTRSVQVLNVAPTVTSTGAATIRAGEAYTLTLDATDPAGSADPVTLTVLWGDGQTSTWTGSPAGTGAQGDVQLTHVYAAAGNLTIQVTADDNDGAPSSGTAAPLQLTVEPGAQPGFEASAAWDALDEVGSQLVNQAAGPVDASGSGLDSAVNGAVTQAMTASGTGHSATDAMSASGAATASVQIASSGTPTSGAADARGDGGAELTDQLILNATAPELVGASVTLRLTARVLGAVAANGGNSGSALDVRLTSGSLSASQGVTSGAGVAGVTVGSAWNGQVVLDVPIVMGSSLTVNLAMLAAAVADVTATGAGSTVSGNAAGALQLRWNAAQIIASNGDTLTSGFTLTAASGRDWLATPSSLPVSISGTADVDQLYGSSGNDVLNGEGGADTLRGFAGNDRYVVDNAGDVVVEAADGGTDTIETLVNLVLPDHVENLTMLGIGDTAGSGNALSNWMVGTSGSNYIDGGAGVDTVLAGSGNDYILGGDGDDTLYGEAGNDTLIGGAGSDNLYGGTGDDTYIVADLGDVIYEDAGGGVDTVQAQTENYVLYANIENVTLAEGSLSGSGNSGQNWMVGNSGNNFLGGGEGSDTLFGYGGNDYLKGDEGDDVLWGGDGNDILEGNAGSDQMYGGAGDDRYVIRDANNLIFEDADAGTDTVETYVDNYVPGAGVENVLLMTGTLSASGNAANNWMEGNSGNNFLGGGLGHDALFGFAGNDYLKGDDGDDRLEGGDGDDTLEGGSGVDTMVGGDGNDTYYVDGPGDDLVETATGGTDTVYCSGNYTLAANLENLQLTLAQDVYGTGNADGNWMRGNDGANTLDGAGGNDMILGAAGNDTVRGGTGNDVVSGDQGNDDYRYARGDGLDHVVQNDTAGTETDVLHFEGAIDRAQMWFSRVGDDLQIRLFGSTAQEQITVDEWFLGDSDQLEQIFDGTGHVLAKAQVAALVDALAGSSAPALGTVSLSTADQALLDAAVASTWTTV